MRRPLKLLYTLVVGLCTILAALAVAYSILQNAFHGSKSIVVVTLVAMVPLAIICHEFGHFLAGWAQGFRLYVVIVGPLKLNREGTELRCRYNSFPWLPLGLVFSLPADERNLRRRMSVFI